MVERPAVGIDRSLLGWVLLGLFVAGVFAFVFYAYVGTFVFAIFIYYATRPVYRRVKERVRPPSLAAGISLFLLALPLLLLLGFTLLIALREATTFASQNQLNVVGTETRTFILLQPYLDLLESPVQLLTSPEKLGSIRELLKETGALTALELAAAALLHGFIMVGVAFYLLVDDDQLSAWLTDRFDRGGGLLAEFMAAVDHDYHQVFFGNILNALITGLIGAVTYNAFNFLAPAGFGVPYPTLVGLLSGAASLVPLVGMKLVYVPVAVYLFGVTVAEGRLDALWFPAGFAAVAFFVVDVIPDMVLRPYVSARELHMGTVMFAYILGPLLFGWYGIFLGPMLLVIAVRFNRVVLPELLARFFGPPSDPPAPGPPVATGSETPAQAEDATASATDEGASAPPADEATTTPPTDEATTTPPTDEAARGEDRSDSPGSDPTAGDD